MRKIIKKSLKSDFFQKIVAWAVYLYICLIYYTSRWQYILPDGYTNDYYINLHNSILVSWHDNITILPLMSPLQFQKNTYALVSPHGDGRIIAGAMQLMGYNIIKGSSNKNALAALKQIIHVLKAGSNAVITPDGPRGPRYQINSNIIAIAKITGSTLIPFMSVATNCFRLNSWDKLIFPLPFGRITVRFGIPIVCDKTTELTTDELALELNKLGDL